MGEQLKDFDVKVAKNELRGKINITGRISFKLVVSLVICLTIIWKIDGGQFCNALFGGICTQISSDSVSKEVIQPTAIPPTNVPPIVASPTAMPPIDMISSSRSGCKFSTQVSSATKTLLITFTATTVERTNIDLDRVILDFIVENLTNEPVTLDMNGNVGIFETGNPSSPIVAAPQLEKSTSFIELAAKGKQVAKMSIDRILDKLPQIDIEFRNLVLNGISTEEGISVIGIPVLCTG